MGYVIPGLRDFSWINIKENLALSSGGKKSSPIWMGVVGAEEGMK